MGLGGVGRESSVGQSLLLAGCFGFHRGMLLHPLGLLPELGDKQEKELKENCRTKAGGYKHVSSKCQVLGPGW